MIDPGLVLDKIVVDLRGLATVVSRTAGNDMQGKLIRRRRFERHGPLLDKLRHALDLRPIYLATQLQNRNLIFPVLLPDTRQIQPTIRSSIPIPAKIMPIHPDDSELPASHVQISFARV